MTNARGVVDASSSEEAASSEEGPRRRSSSAASAAAAFAAETVSGNGFFSKTGFASTATDAGARAAGGGVRGLRILVFRLGSVYTTALCLYLSLCRRGVVAVDGGEERGSRPLRPPFVTLRE